MNRLFQKPMKTLETLFHILDRWPLFDRIHTYIYNISAPAYSAKLNLGIFNVEECPSPHHVSSHVAHSFDPTTLPPSKAIVAPLTQAPDLLDSQMHVPAISSGLPILPRGTPLAIASPNFSSVAFIILL